MSRRIAIVGAGISGLVAAYVLSRTRKVTLFEAAARPGGHTNTIELDVDGSVHHVDTGFIVFNDRTYPGFCELLRQLGVRSKPTDMSFSVQCAATGLEYRGSGLGTFFAQRGNLLRPRHWRLLREILRFNREAPAVLDRPEDGTMLREHLASGGYGDDLRDRYLVPMAAALWSTDPATVLDFPVHYFVRFFHHHGFFSLRGRPTWLVVEGGSQRYVERLVDSVTDAIGDGWLRTGTPVRAIRRHDHGVEVRLDTGTETFDEVVLATHSDQALRMLVDADATEREVLSDVAYQPNEAVLHTDPSVMPAKRRAWSSWNYHLPVAGSGGATVSYWMNRLQGLAPSPTFFVTLNRTDEIDPALVHRRIRYHHPVYTPAARAAQQRWDEVNGVRRTWFCGAWWGWGFHEDGVQSALRVCQALGASL